MQLDSITQYNFIILSLKKLLAKYNVKYKSYLLHKKLLLNTDKYFIH
jgi:hypothetical protein